MRHVKSKKRVDPLSWYMVERDDSGSEQLIHFSIQITLEMSISTVLRFEW